MEVKYPSYHLGIHYPMFLHHLKQPVKMQHCVGDLFLTLFSNNRLLWAVDHTTIAEALC